MRAVFLALAVALALPACGGSTEMSTEGYDKTCTIAEDCRVVFVGDVCGCPCEVDAIRTNDANLWARERSDKQDRCDEVLTCQPCPDVHAVCEQDTCQGVQGQPATDDTDA